MIDVPFRFVIVGSGNMCGTYVGAIGNLDGVEVVGLVSRGKRRPDCLSDVDVAIAGGLRSVGRDFDAVIVTTPNGLHHQAAIEAAELGKHVLTEKVLDVSVEHMDAMIGACDLHDVKLGVAFQRRMSPDNAAVKRLLDDGCLGRIFAADLAVKFFRDQAYYDSGAYRGTISIDGGGPFMQQAAHNVDIYCWFFGMPAKVASLLGTFCHDIECEDHGTALLRHPDGMIGTITASTAAKPGFAPRLEIHAEAGSIVMENDEITSWAVDGVDNPSRRGGFKVHSGAGSAAVTDTGGHEAIVRDFVDAVRQGRPPAVPGESARMATELVLKIYESALD